MHDFSVRLRTGSNPEDINRFRSHTGKLFKNLFLKNPSHFQIIIKLWKNLKYFDAILEIIVVYLESSLYRAGMSSLLEVIFSFWWSVNTRLPCNKTMDIEYVDIMTGENLLSIQVATMVLIYWSVRSSSRRGRKNKRGGQNQHIIRISHTIPMYSISINQTH